MTIHNFIPQLLCDSFSKKYDNIGSSSPDLSPPDYFLFPKIKLRLKNRHFDEITDIQSAAPSEIHHKRRFLNGHERFKNVPGHSIKRIILKN